MIPPELIDPDADKVVRRLSRHDHAAYLVGGCVRDLLLGRKPKDFDVATSATPPEIRNLFRNCRIIGRRFTLAHIIFGSNIIETSTFRANPRETSDGEGELLIRRDNVFGSVTEDARRRDFTVNGLFYDVETQEVIDHVDGLRDLESRLIRTIGDPGIRFQEDPVRILRAIKFAARLEFNIEEETYAALLGFRGEVAKSAPPRVLEEVYRFLRGGAAVRSMQLLADTGVAAVLSTRLAGMLGGGVPVPASLPDAAGNDEALWRTTWAEDFANWSLQAPTEMQLTDSALELSFASPTQIAAAQKALFALLSLVDSEVAEGSAPSSSMLLSLLVLPFLGPLLDDDDTNTADLSAAISETLGPLVQQLKVARRDADRARHILLAQQRLRSGHLPGGQRRRGQSPSALTSREFFLDALHVLSLHTAASGNDESSLDYWREQSADIVDTEADGQPRKRRRRRRGGRSRRHAQEGADDLEVQPAPDGV